MVAHAQPKRSIYLGDDMAAKFDAGSMSRDIDLDYSFFKFLGYQTLWHGMLSNSTIESTQRDGIILTAKSTNTTIINASAAFAKNNDSCIIDYQARIDNVRHGRSAALSVLNLFSKWEYKLRQPEPYTTIGYVQSQGVIRHNNEDASFLYSISYKNKMIPNGWLVLHGDTLYCKPVTQQYKRKGKLKKARYLFLTGFMLIKNDTIYAAIDQSNLPDTAYIDNQLTEAEKLVIAAYLFIVACYQ